VPLLLGVLVVAIAAVGGTAFYLSRQGAEESQPEASSSSTPKKKGKRSKDAPKASATAAARPTARATVDPSEDDEAEPAQDAPPEPTATADATGRPASPTRPKIGPRPGAARPTRKIEPQE
jgi:cytoskeletal protein RodZ